MKENRLNNVFFPNTLKSQLHHLIILGLIEILTGLLIASVCIIGRAYYGIVELIFTLAGLSVGYLLAVKIHPGGEVNYYRDFLKERTKMDINLDALIRKNRNILVVNIGFILLLLAALGLPFLKNEVKDQVSFWESIFGCFMLSFFASITLLTGLKYVSAWLKIKMR